MNSVKRVYLLVFLSGWLYLSVGGARLAVSLYAIHEHASPALIGAVMALFSAIGTFGAVPTGRWVDRKGTITPMLIACVMVVVGALVGVFALAVSNLLFIAILVGTAWSIFYVATQHLFGHYGGPSQRLRNFSLSGVGMSAATFCAPVIAGLAIDHLGYNSTFAIMGLLAIVPLVVVAMRKLELPAEEMPEPVATAAVHKGSVLTLLRNRDLRRVYVTSITSQAIWHSYIFLLPIFGAQIGLSATTIGLLSGAFAFAGGVVRGLAPLLARYFTTWQLLLLSLAVSAAILAMIPFFPSFGGQVALSLMLGMALGVASPLGMVLAHESAPPGRVAEVVGLRVGMMYGMQSVAPLAMGAIGAATGLGSVFWLMGGLLALQCYAERRQWRKSASLGDS